MIDLIEVAKLGIDAEAFYATPIGKHLRQKAIDEIEAATERLIQCPADDERGNRAIRNEIHVARMFLLWMAEAIQVGASAYEQVREQDEIEREM